MIKCFHRRHNTLHWARRRGVNCDKSSTETKRRSWHWYTQLGWSTPRPDNMPDVRVVLVAGCQVFRARWAASARRGRRQATVAGARASRAAALREVEVQPPEQARDDVLVGSSDVRVLARVGDDVVELWRGGWRCRRRGRWPMDRSRACAGAGLREAQRR